MLFSSPLNVKVICKVTESLPTAPALEHFFILIVWYRFCWWMTHILFDRDFVGKPHISYFGRDYCRMSCFLQILLLNGAYHANNRTLAYCDFRILQEIQSLGVRLRRNSWGSWQRLRYFVDYLLMPGTW